MKYLAADEVRSLGLLQELNRTMLHPLGLAAEINMDDGSLRFQDWRKDPEGMVYANNVMSAVKYKAFNTFRKQRHDARRTALGFVVQSAPVE